MGQAIIRQRYIVGNNACVCGTLHMHDKSRKSVSKRGKASSFKESTLQQTILSSLIKYQETFKENYRNHSNALSAGLAVLPN